MITNPKLENPASNARPSQPRKAPKRHKATSPLSIVRCRRALRRTTFKNCHSARSTAASPAYAPPRFQPRSRAIRRSGEVASGANQREQTYAIRSRSTGRQCGWHGACPRNTACADLDFGCGTSYARSGMTVPTFKQLSSSSRKIKIPVLPVPKNRIQTPQT